MARRSKRPGLFLGRFLFKTGETSKLLSFVQDNSKTSAKLFLRIVALLSRIIILIIKINDLALFFALVIIKIQHHNLSYAKAQIMAFRYG